MSVGKEIWRGPKWFGEGLLFDFSRVCTLGRENGVSILYTLFHTIIHKINSMGTLSFFAAIRGPWLYKISFFRSVIIFSPGDTYYYDIILLLFKMEKVPSCCACFISRVLGDATNQQLFTGMNSNVFDPHCNIGVSIGIISPADWDRGLTSSPEVSAAAYAGGLTSRSIPFHGNSRISAPMLWYFQVLTFAAQGKPINGFVKNSPRIWDSQWNYKLLHDDKVVNWESLVH